MQPISRFALVGVLAALSVLAIAPSAGATTFTNPGLITMSAAAPGPSDATPYQSPIAVSGIPGPITDLNVRINGFTHTKPNDVAFLLVAPPPGSQALMVYNGAGAAVPVAAPINITLDDSAPTVLPGGSALTAGSYRPASYFAGSNFQAPGPGTSYGNPGPISGGTATFASQFNGLSANGTWSLFVRDFVAGNGGQFANGWSLEIEPSTLAPAPVPGTPANTTGTKKCKKKKKRSAAAKSKKCKKRKK